MSHSQSSAPPPSAPVEQTQLGGSGRKLTLVDAVAQSVGFMGPVFSMAFLVPLIVGLGEAAYLSLRDHAARSRTASDVSRQDPLLGDET